MSVQDAEAPVEGTPGAATPAAAAATTIPARVLAGGSVLRTVGAPLLLGVLMIGVWQLLVVALSIDPFIVPAPSAIAAQFADNLGNVASGAARTGANALVGLLAGAVVGILGALLAAALRPAEAVAAPVVSALSVMPIVALAPVLYGMYGADLDTARQIVAGLAVLIPVYVNTLRGLRQVRAVHRDLMRVYAATPWQQQLAVTLPTAAPYVFTGLRIASSLAVISSLVAEYFGGPVGGLGKSITSAASSSNYALAWAYVLGSILLGLAFYGAALAVERLATRHRAG